MYKITFYVPISHLEKVKKAIFRKGAGKYKNYSHCCWQVLGEGQFKPLKGSTPFLGKENEIVKVKEYRVDLICEEKRIKEVIQELIRVHPYEEPAYHITKILNIYDL